VDSLVHLWHGDRILWGNNHFFRYVFNLCPPNHHSVGERLSQGG
jgi:hypothetical protein